MTGFELGSLLILTVTAIAVYKSAKYGAHQLEMLRRSHTEGHDWNRRKAAQDAALLYRARVKTAKKLEQKLNYVERRDQIPLNELKECFKNDITIKPTLVRLLNYYEALARGVEMHIYEEEIIRAAWGRSMVRARYKFGAYITDVRMGPSNKAYEYLVRLTDRWENNNEYENHELKKLATEEEVVQP